MKKELEFTLSIVVPIYNSEKMLRRCIESILNQTFKDFELILINDGSNDNSLQICEEFCCVDKRIHVYSHSNKGVSYTRNFGIATAKGKYLIFVDSDDSLLYDYCEKIICAQKKLGDNYCIMSSIKLVNKRNIIINQYDDEVISYLSKSDILKIYSKMLFSSPTNKLYNLSLLQEKYIRFQNDVSIAEDLLFNLNYFQLAEVLNIAILNDMYYLYIRSNISLSHSYHPLYYDIHKKIYSLFYKCCQEWKVPKEDYILLYQGYWAIMNECLNNTLLNDNNTFFQKIRINNNLLKNPVFIRLHDYNKPKMGLVKYHLYRHGDYLFIYILKNIKQLLSYIKK